jgi:hypothetical protein
MGFFDKIGDVFGKAGDLYKKGWEFVAPVYQGVGNAMAGLLPAGIGPAIGKAVNNVAGHMAQGDNKDSWTPPPPPPTKSASEPPLNPYVNTLPFSNSNAEDDANGLGGFGEKVKGFLVKNKKVLIIVGIAGALVGGFVLYRKNKGGWS